MLGRAGAHPQHAEVAVGQSGGHSLERTSQRRTFGGRLVGLRTAGSRHRRLGHRTVMLALGLVPARSGRGACRGNHVENLGAERRSFPFANADHLAQRGQN